MLCEQFSAMHSQPWSGKKKFISAGASVSGVSWKMMRMPSTTSSSPVNVMSSVGAMRPGELSGTPLPRPQSTWPFGPGRQQRAELVERPAVHRVAGQQVLGDGLAHEVLGGDDPAAAGVDVGLGGDAEHAAEVVEVAVRVDDRGDRPLAEVRVGQLEAGARRWR